MAFVPPAPVIRRNLILNKLKKCGAVSPETAKTLAEAGVPNPDGFRKVTEVMLRQGVIHQTSDGKYYR